MPDTMTLTKIFGAFFGALLVFLLTRWLATMIYIGAEHPGAEEAHAERGYVVLAEAEAGGHEEASAEEGPSFEELLASADPAAGKKVFKKCQACHSAEPGVNKTGPSLHGVVGRDIASVEGFGYSEALSSLEGSWTPERLAAFVSNPKAFAPGTKMGFAGLKKAKDRANLIAYLESVGG